MAGHIFQQRVHAVRGRFPFARRNMVEASVSILGSTYTTLMREGASAEELIEKVARETGGGVAKVYYPEFRTWEIVAVKIGDKLLVKGDPDKVSEADFSSFSDPQMMKALAVRYSDNSEGGIHFSIGSSGIPMAVTGEQGIVFPNAEELKVGRGTSNIALWMTSVNINPRTIADLDRAYSPSGGVKVSADALREISKSHGGVRSDRLMLDDNILILNKDTGEIMAANQHALAPEQQFAPARAEFFSVPALPPPQAVPAVDACRMDAFRVPYLSVVRFDGSINELIRVSLPALLPAKGQSEPAKGTAGRLPETKLRFSLLESRPAESSGETLPISVPIVKNKIPDAASKSPIPGQGAEITGPSALRRFLEPRIERLSIGIPLSASEIPPGRKRKKRRRERMARRELPVTLARDEIPLTPPGRIPAKEMKKPHIRNKHKISREKFPKWKLRKPATRAAPERTRKSGSKPFSHKNRLERFRAIAKAAVERLKGEKSGRLPKVPRPAGIKVPEKAGRKKAAVNSVQANALPARKSARERKKVSGAVEKKAKRKIHRYFLHALLGLFQRKRRGRKLRMKNSRAE